MASLHDIIRGDVIPLSGLAVSLGRNTFDPPSPTVPFFDIHNRSSILYDSGFPTNSGIFAYNADKLRLQLIPSNSGAQPVVTAVFLEVYDGAGGGTLNTTKTTVSFDTVRHNTHPLIYAFASNEVQINMSGTYNFHWRVSSLNTAIATNTTVSTWLEQQIPGGSYAEVSGTRAYDNNFFTINVNTVTLNSFALVAASGVGWKYRVRSENSAQSTTQIANGTALTIQKVY